MALWAQRPVVRLLVNREINGAAAEDARAVAGLVPREAKAPDRFEDERIVQRGDVAGIEADDRLPDRNEPMPLRQEHPHIVQRKIAHRRRGVAFVQL